MAETDVYPEEIITLLDGKVHEYGSVASAAKAWGVTPQMVHMVIKGVRPPSPGMLADLGLEKAPPEIKYRRLGSAQK